VIVDRVGFDVGAERDLVDGQIRRLVVIGVTCCKTGMGRPWSATATKMTVQDVAVV